MNALMSKAIAAIQKLPDKEQEALAREVLDRLEADACWEVLFSDPRSDEALAEMVKQARDEIAQGLVFDGDPGHPPKRN
jgi:hypothetical protein